MKRIGVRQYAQALFEIMREEDVDIKRIAKNWIQLLLRERNLRRAPEIIRALEELYAKEGIRIEGELRTAQTLSSSEIREWQEKFEKILKTSVRFKATTDVQLLGGAIVKIQNTVYDGSIRTSIMQLRTQLLKK